MYILTLAKQPKRYRADNPMDLEDIILKATGDMNDAYRIAMIANHMRIGEVYSNPEMLLKRVIGEERPK